MNSGRLRPDAGDRFFSLARVRARSASAARLSKVSPTTVTAPPSAGPARRNRRTTETPRRPRPPPPASCEAQGVCHISSGGWRRRAAKLFWASASAPRSALRAPVAVPQMRQQPPRAELGDPGRIAGARHQAVAQGRGAIHHHRGRGVMRRRHLHWAWPHRPAATADPAVQSSCQAPAITAFSRSRQAALVRRRNRPRPTSLPPRPACGRPPALPARRPPSHRGR